MRSPSVTSAFIALCLGLSSLVLLNPPSSASELDSELEENAGTARMRGEAATGSNRFVLTPHKRNYFLFTYSDRGSDEAFQDPVGDDNAELDDAETQFQVSIKVALDRNMWVENDALQFCFTLKSFWQT